VPQIFEKRDDKDGKLEAVVLDFVDVKHADMSGIMAMKEVLESAKKLSIKVFLVNMTPEIVSHLVKAHIEDDDLSQCSPELQAKVGAAQALAAGACTEALDAESLGMVSDLLRQSKSNSLLELAQWAAAEKGTIADATRNNSDGDLGVIEMSLQNGAYTVVATEADVATKV
jgi:ABC-type transporter Mla MlaB component